MAMSIERVTVLLAIAVFKNAGTVLKECASQAFRNSALDVSFPHDHVGFLVVLEQVVEILGGRNCPPLL
jgi:hypothetical protein